MILGCSCRDLRLAVWLLVGLFIILFRRGEAFRNKLTFLGLIHLILIGSLSPYRDLQSLSLNFACIVSFVVRLQYISFNSSTIPPKQIYIQFLCNSIPSSPKYNTVQPTPNTEH